MSQPHALADIPPGNETLAPIEWRIGEPQNLFIQFVYITYIQLKIILLSIKNVYVFQPGKSKKKYLHSYLFID